MNYNLVAEMRYRPLAPLPLSVRMASAHRQAEKHFQIKPAGKVVGAAKSNRTCGEARRYNEIILRSLLRYLLQI